MSSSHTTTSTFTIANARHVAAKVKTDLKLLQRAYGEPSDQRIDDFGEEAAQMLNAGYLRTVTYGFKKDGAWIVALRYTANNDGTLATDDRAGQIPRGVPVAGASFHSFMNYSAKWDVLTSSEWETFKKTLPIQRTSGSEPGTSGGYWSTDHTYSSNGSGVARTTFKPL
jgi:hypothetical protein